MIAHGVRMLGACCGSGPEHIRGIASAAKMKQAAVVEVGKAPEEKIKPRTETTIEVDASQTPSLLAAKLRAGGFPVSVEIDPPVGTDCAKALEAAAQCRDANVDCINIADGPRASARMSPIDMSVLLNRDVGGIEPIVHFCCRDRNLLGLQADLLGANALGVYNILIITGDPPKLGDYPFATSVYDVDAIGAIKIAKGLNAGHDLAGNPMKGPPTKLFIGAGANPGAIDLDLEVDRLDRKVEAGAEYIMTQPVYEISLFEKFCERIAHVKVPILVGILPLASYKNAEFLHREVPGMQVPHRIRLRMKEAPGKDEERAEGVRIAQEALRQSRHLAQGTYIMPPFNRVSSALAVLEALEESE